MRLLLTSISMLTAALVLCRVALSGTPIVYGYAYADRCPAAGIADAVDRWEMDECNCTSFVAWALATNGQRTNWFIPGAMDAWNWPHVAALSGLHVGRTPRVGAVAVWKRLSRFGHIAYVIGVHTDGRFDVAEYNLPSGGALQRFGFDERIGIRAEGAEFIYVPPRSS